MNISKFLKETYKIETIPFGVNEKLAIPINRPRIVCNDGFSMSVQAGEHLYSIPRQTLREGYKEVEIGFPSEYEPLIELYSEDSNYTNTVYPYVPIEIVDKVLIKHGGIDENKTLSEWRRKWLKN